MSTRCNIYIHDSRDGSSLWIYHHHDGYPEGVGRQLKDFLSDADNRLLRPEGMLEGLVYVYGDEYEETTNQHGDISYRYDIEITPVLTTLTINRMSYTFEGNRYKQGHDEIEKVEYINDISSGKEMPAGNEKSWKVSELRKMLAKISFEETVNLMDCGITDNIPDDMKIHESTIRYKIIDFLLKSFEKNACVEFIEK